MDALDDVHEFSKILKLDASERFGECVSNHFVGWAILNLDVTHSDHLTDEMKMDIDVLGSSMEF